MNGVTVKSLPPPPVNVGEVLRYAGQRGEAAQNICQLLEECIAESASVLQYRVAYLELPCPVDWLAPAADRLAECQSTVLFAATVGVGMDRLIARYSRTQPAKALLLDALGSERIEALCDAFCESALAEKRVLGLAVTPRFSPGYGKLPLELQRQLIGLLDTPRGIGLTLNESLLLSPTKSVTAIVGLKGKED